LIEVKKQSAMGFFFVRRVAERVMEDQADELKLIGES